MALQRITRIACKILLADGINDSSAEQGILVMLSLHLKKAVDIHVLHPGIE